MDLAGTTPLTPGLLGSLHMLKLSTIQSVMETVDTNWHCPIADALLEKYATSANRPHFWRVSANFLFYCQVGNGEFALRLNHVDERSVEQIASELKFVSALGDSRVQVAQPQISRFGNPVETVVTPAGTFHGVLFEKLPGEHLELDHMDDSQLSLWDQPWPTYTIGQAHSVRPAGGVGTTSWIGSKRRWYAADIVFALRDLIGENPATFDPQSEELVSFIAGYQKIRTTLLIQNIG